LIYNNGGTPVSFEAEYIPGALIDSDMGAWLLDSFLSGAIPLVSFPQTGGAGNVNNPTGGLISSYSTFGPTFDAYLKPSVAAPGGGILSTIPQAMGEVFVYLTFMMVVDFSMRI
jgi:hypothetical protein